MATNETQSSNRQEAEKLLAIYNEYEEKLFQGGKAYQEVPEHAWGDLEDQIEALGFGLNSPPQRLSTLKPLK
jgi:hypothetical protein